MTFLSKAIDFGALELAELTYPEVGATRGVLPPEYRHLNRHVILGSGEDTFTRAGGALMSWHMHRGAGLTVMSTTPTADQGTLVVMRVGKPVPCVQAPCRVVYIVDEPSRRGFAYGTLPGHPECGEEAFIVELTAHGEVRLIIRAFFRPAGLLTRAAGSLTYKIQQLITDRYISSLRNLSNRSA